MTWKGLIAMAVNIYIAGIGQHSGKTLLSVGLTAAFCNRGYQVGYMKPVGQRTIQIGDVAVDEDVALMYEAFQINVSPTASNPVTIPPGFTRKFLREGGDSSALQQLISDSYNTIVGSGPQAAQVVIIEGTGHAGVGSIIGLSNAVVARLLNARVLVVTGGGIGRPVDDFVTNKALFRQEGVPILGVVANKIFEDGYDKVSEALNLWFRSDGVPLLGLIPYHGALSAITLRQIVAETKCTVLNGAEYLSEHIYECIVAAGTPGRMLPLLQPGTLAIMPGDRDDLVLAALSVYKSSQPGGAAICLTSGIMPGDEIMRLLKQSSMPVLATEEGTYAITSRVSDLVAKTGPTEKEKLALAEKLVAQYVDVDQILNLVGMT
jgi:BioD-like phosphotransacetylase family protein